MNYTIKAEPSEYWVKYLIYEVAGYTLEPAKTPLYGEEFTTRIEDGYLIASGEVKWDGCSNWEFNTEVMLHGCNREDLEAIGRALAECWDMTATLCPHWDP